jgi:hypothetical protein
MWKRSERMQSRLAAAESGPRRQPWEEKGEQVTHPGGAKEPILAANSRRRPSAAAQEESYCAVAFGGDFFRPLRGSGGRSAGPARRPCGFSSGAAFCRTANKMIQILFCRAASTAAHWKSRKAGERALRYILSGGRFANCP